MLTRGVLDRILCRYIYTIVRYMGGFLTPRVAEYGMYGYGCMGVGCIPTCTYVDVRAWAVFKGSGIYCTYTDTGT